MPWSLIGNARALNILQRSLESDRAQQAYLLAGPEQTGRATAAMLLAQALNCTADDRPCEECGQCRRIAAGIHSDVQTVTVEISEDGPARRDISVEQLREVEQSIALAPYEGRRRVIIVAPAELMNASAQNAFLKSLEEPPPHVVFILITVDTDRLLETVRSRCTIVPFSLVPTGEIEAALRGRGVEPDRASLIGRLAAGRAGWALSAVDDKRFLESRQESLDQARRLPDTELADRFELAQKLAEAFRKNRQKALSSLDEWTLWWRDVMVLQSGSPESVVNSDRLADLQEDANAYTIQDVKDFVESLVRASHYLTMNVQPRIALDAIMLSVPRAREQSNTRR
jgi:DNA polymerase-3 subunit delta'